MPQVPPLSLSRVINISESLTPAAIATPTFNQGLIMGTSTVIPSTGTGSTGIRVRQYSSLAGMVSDGFSTSSPEYIAAQLYFGVNSPPQYVNIGRQDLSAIQTAIPNAGSPGTGYVVGDLITVVQSSASFGVLKVTTIGTNGVVTGLATLPGQQGTGYSDATGLSTTGGTGTGLEVDITAIGESAADALTQCRLVSANWYCCTFATSLTDGDILACAEAVQSFTPYSYFYVFNGDAGVLAGTTNNVLYELNAEKYSRTFYAYSTTQGGAFPNNAYGAGSAMGTYMGMNTGLANSYFTAMFKPLVGVAPEPLTVSQVNAIEALKGNVYVQYSGGLSWLENGTSVDGSYMDQILGVDMLAADLQTSFLNLLISTPSLPQTDGGQQSFINAADAACQRAVARGFVAPGGTWTGQTVLSLTAGTAMPKGYLCQSPSFSTQSAGDRAARKGMPVYVSVVLAGSVQSISIGIFVQS